MPHSQRKTSPITSCPDSKVEWVIVSLSSNGERESNLEMIRKSVVRILKNQNLEVYVPAVSQTVRGESEIMFYMQGYIFIKHMDGVPYYRLRETQYFTDVLCTYLNRKIRYKLLDNNSFLKIKNGVDNLRISSFVVGDEVFITKGDFKNLPGIVSCVYDEEQVQVAISLRSKKLLIDSPSTYIQKR